MAQITFTDLVIPTPTPYSAEDPMKNWGDLCYVLLQIANQAKAQGVVFDDQVVKDIKDAIHDYSLSVLAVAELEREDSP